ncbi:MAG: tetratricopeptide repeat protein [Clostridiales bacterium]|jgi:tetratricopeptide (TPR) repeat protein|nr:tetratricopeptide repeat protein [Clostridiales bacterium]
MENTTAKLSENLSAREHLTQGSMLAGQGKHEAALACFDRAEREDPMDINVYLSKGVACASLGRLDEARAQFEKALKLNRSSGLAHFHLGSVALLQGDTALGLEHYSKAAANGYDDAQLHYSMGLLHEENGEADMAIRSYAKAIRRDAMRADIRVRKARLLLQLERFPEALQALDELLLVCPDAYEGYHLKFAALMRQKQPAKAGEVLDGAAELFPDEPGLAFDRAALLAGQGRPDDALAALDALESALEAGGTVPADGAADGANGAADGASGIAPVAIAAEAAGAAAGADGAPALAPDDVVRRRIYLERAQICATREDVPSAIAALERAKALSEAAGRFDAEAAFLLANCHLSAEEYGKVLGCARQLLEKAGDGYIKETARYFEPLALKMLGRMDEALPLYKSAIGEFRSQSLANPGNLDAYMLRAMCLRDTGEFDKALELAEYVMALQPERAEPRLLKAAVLEALGRDGEAGDEAKAASAMLPKEPLAK